MDCTRTQSLAHGYLDGELDPGNIIAVEEHLHSCAACKRTYDGYSALQAALRQHATYHAAPAALADRIRISIGATPESAPAVAATPRWRWSQFGQWLQFGTAMAATAAVTWVVGLQMNGPSPDEAVSEQVIASFARSELTRHVTDVENSDRHTVKPWLSSKLDFSPQVTDLTAAGYPLVGGRLDYLDNRPVAVLVYRHRQHLVNLF